MANNYIDTNILKNEITELIGKIQQANHELLLLYLESSNKSFDPRLRQYEFGLNRVRILEKEKEITEFEKVLTEKIFFYIKCVANVNDIVFLESKISKLDIPMLSYFFLNEGLCYDATATKRHISSILNSGNDVLLDILNDNPYYQEKADKIKKEQAMNKIVVAEPKISLKRKIYEGMNL